VICTETKVGILKTEFKLFGNLNPKNLQFYELSNTFDDNRNTFDELSNTFDEVEFPLFSLSSTITFNA